MEDSKISNEEKIELVKKVVELVPPVPIEEVSPVPVEEESKNIEKPAVDPLLTTEKEIEQKLEEFNEEEKEKELEPIKPVEIDPKKAS